MLFEQKFYKINVQNYLKIIFSICIISRRRRLKKEDTEGDKKIEPTITFSTIEIFCVSLQRKSKTIIMA